MDHIFRLFEEIDCKIRNKASCTISIIIFARKKTKKATQLMTFYTFHLRLVVTNLGVQQKKVFKSSRDEIDSEENTWKFLPVHLGLMQHDDDGFMNMNEWSTWCDSTSGAERLSSFPHRQGPKKSSSYTTISSTVSRWFIDVFHFTSCLTNARGHKNIISMMKTNLPHWRSCFSFDDSGVIRTRLT